MKNVFSLDSPLMNFLSRVADILLLNFLWLLCCIPVLTIGASTTAMNYAAQNLVRDCGRGVFSDFFSAFRREFRQATGMFLLLLVPYAFIAFDLYLYLTGTLSSRVMLTVCVLALFLLLLTTGFAYPLLARFENTTLQTLKNALALSLSNFPRALLITALNVLPLVVLLFATDFFLKTLIVWLAAGGGTICYFDTRILKKLFARLEDAPAPDGAAEG